MSLNSRTTSLITTTNLMIILAVVVIAGITKNPLAILGLFFIQDVPLFQDQVGIEQLRQLGIIDSDDDGDAPPGERAYDNTKIGFTAQSR